MTDTRLNDGYEIVFLTYERVENYTSIDVS